MNDGTLRRIWLVGATQTAEFQPLVDWLAQSTTTSFATGIETFRPEPNTSREVPVVWVVFLSPRPDSVPRELVERWQRWFPLARFVVVLGSWCEGEVRTGRPWPGVVRVYWHQWRARLATQWMAQPLSQEWQLPGTATEAERLEALLRPAVVSTVADSAERATELIDRQIAVWSRSALEREIIADALKLAGATPWNWLEPTQDLPARTHAVVLDLAESIDPAQQLWCASVWRERRIPALALVNFPRWEDHCFLAELGIELLSKPWRVVDLHRQLSQMISATIAYST